MRWQISFRLCALHEWPNFYPSWWGPSWTNPLMDTGTSSSHISGCPYTWRGVAGDRTSSQVWVFQDSGGEAEVWERTVMTLGTSLIYLICHLSKRKIITLVLKATPLNVCLLVTVEETFLLILWMVQFFMECEDMEKLPWPSGSLSAEDFSQPVPGLCPTLQSWMVLHPCWSLMYSHCSSVFSFSLESPAPVCQCSSVKSDMCRACFDQPHIKFISRLNKTFPVIILGIWSWGNILLNKVAWKNLCTSDSGSQQQQLGVWFAWKDC